VSGAKQKFEMRMRLRMKGSAEKIAERVLAIARARAPIRTGALHDSFATRIEDIDAKSKLIVLSCLRYARYVGVFGAAFKPIILGGADPATITRQSGKGFKRKKRKKGKRKRARVRDEQGALVERPKKRGRKKAKRGRGRPKKKAKRGRAPKPRPRGRPRKQPTKRK